MKTVPKVRLLQSTDLPVCATAIRTCWDSHEKATPDGDIKLIHRVGVGNNHASTLEHMVYSFYISDISRALLQELARHRIASFSVKSTRYCLKELLACNAFHTMTPEVDEANNLSITHEYNQADADKYLVWTDVDEVDKASMRALESLRQCVVNKIPNDKAKFCLPDSLKTELTFTINARSLRNFLSLRTSKAAMWEIRTLAHGIHNTLPDAHKYLYEDVVTILPDKDK